MKLELNSPSQLPNIMGNPIRLRQMVGALLQNAIDYTPEQGHIQIQLWAEEQVVFLKVQDSGIGIPAEEQAFVFDKFYRATNTLKMSSRSGLGLSIVKNIVDQHGGRIWLESHLEQGSIFTVMLPAASRDSA
jgi:signal transduction histidine kinase